MQPADYASLLLRIQQAAWAACHVDLAWCAAPGAATGLAGRQLVHWHPPWPCTRPTKAPLVLGCREIQLSQEVAHAARCDANEALKRAQHELARNATQQQASWLAIPAHRLSFVRDIWV